MSFNIGAWYFVAQSFGYLPTGPETNYYRKPTVSEMRASVNIALAHGAKGIFFWNYYSFWRNIITQDTLCDAIVDMSETPTELYYEIKDNLAPRLKGKLGRTLLGLSYTGNYIQHKFFLPTEQPPPPVTNGYLTVGLNQSIRDMNWHIGFLEDKNNAYDNKFFLMANLITNTAKTIQVKVTPPVTNFVNYRFRDIEPQNNFDVSFTSQSIQTFTYPAGEGRLFQVAPVVKYGGKLIANETISSPTTLSEDMTIENGATFFVNSTYTANANITVKNGGKIIGGSNGQIAFTDGMKLIIEGSAQINGTENNPLVLFYEPTTSYGIEVKQGASLDISYCKIMEAEVGLITEPYFNSVKI